jgi:hypothetical protein
MLCPWADVLYAMDKKWWERMHKEVSGFTGIEGKPWQSWLAVDETIQYGGGEE